MTPPTLRRSSAADGNAKAKRYVLGVPNGTADLGDLRRRPCGPAHSPTQPDPCDLRESAHLMPGGGRHCTATACRTARAPVSRVLIGCTNGFRTTQPEVERAPLHADWVAVVARSVVAIGAVAIGACQASICGKATLSDHATLL